MEFTLAEWAEEYLSYAKKFTSKTYKEKCFTFRKFFERFDPMLSVTAIDRGLALKHFQGQSQERSGHGANKQRKNLLAAWNWGVKYINGFPTLNPFLTDKFPEERKPTYVPAEKDFWKVFDVVEDDDQVMLLVYLHTAARRGEIFRLGWDDVDFGNSRVRLWTRKREGGTMEYDWIPLTDTLYNLLLERKQQSSSQWVFPNPETGTPYIDRKRWMGSICRRAGVKQFGFHAIRHLTASILAQAGTSSIVIQGILRHKKVSTTEKYLHRLSDLRPALQVLSGGGKTLKKPSGEKVRNFELKTIN